MIVALYSGWNWEARKRGIVNVWSAAQPFVDDIDTSFLSTGHSSFLIIKNIHYIAYYHIRDLRRIRRYMYFAVAKAIATKTVVSSRYDYCNSLYHYNVLNEILKLQHVQFF